MRRCEDTVRLLRNTQRPKYDKRYEECSSMCWVSTERWRYRLDEH